MNPLSSSEEQVLTAGIQQESKGAVSSVVDFEHGRWIHKRAPNIRNTAVFYHTPMYTLSVRKHKQRSYCWLDVRISSGNSRRARGHCSWHRTGPGRSDRHRPRDFAVRGSALKLADAVGSAPDGHAGPLAAVCNFQADGPCAGTARARPDHVALVIIRGSIANGRTPTAVQDISLFQRAHVAEARRIGGGGGGQGAGRRRISRWLRRRFTVSMVSLAEVANPRTAALS